MDAKKHEVPEVLLADYKKPEDLIGEKGLLKQLTKLLVEKASDAELTEHLGRSMNELVANAAGNTRASCSSFRVLPMPREKLTGTGRHWM